MNPILQKFIDAKAPMALNPPAAPQAIAQFEQQKTISKMPQPKSFPNYYREFLAAANGGVFFEPDNIRFFGIGTADNKESLEYQNNYNRGAVRDYIPLNLYIVAESAWGHPLAIDLDSQELVDWEQDKKKEARRWASIAEYIENAFQIHLKRMEHFHPALQRLIDLGYEMESRPPANEQDIAKFEQKSGVQLPAHYRSLLSFANGFCFGGVFGTEFFSIGALGGKNKKKKCNIPDSMYIIGDTEYATTLCIDLGSQEVVEWSNKEKREIHRFATVFDYIEHEIGYHPAVCKIKDIFYSAGDLIVLFGEGIFAGQTIHMVCKELDNGHFIPLYIVAEQISLVTREQLLSGYKKFQVIRELPEKEYRAVLGALKAYRETSGGQQLGMEFF